MDSAKNFKEQADTKFGTFVGTSGAPEFKQEENIIDLIVQDHNEAKAQYEAYKNASTLEDKIRLRNVLIKSLVQHDECEQLLVYPLLKERVGGQEGEDHFRRSLGEHQELREMLYKVRYGSFKENPSQYDFKLANAMDAVMRHIAAEESQVLPLLRQHVQPDELRRVGASFKAHKYTAVTRPHPMAPMQGYPAALANLILKPFDQIRDYWEGVQ